MKFAVSAFCLALSLASYSQNWNTAEVASLPEPVANNAVCEGFSPAGNFVYSFAGIDSSLGYSGIHLKSWRVNTQTLQVDVLPDLPDTLGKVAAGASRVGNIIYVIGGYHVLANGNEISSNKVHRFDVAQNQFISDGTNIPIPIDDHVQTVYRDSLIFIVSGWSNTGNVPAVQIYNIHTNSWSVGTSVPNNNSYKCFGASGEILGDTLYYFGGAAGFNFSAQTELRKGYIDPLNPTDIEWSVSNLEPSVTGYRNTACTTIEAIHWIGGSNTTYNFNAIAYNGSGLVRPANRSVYYHPTSGTWGVENAIVLPMDLRGIANVSDNEKYLMGGINADGIVSNSVLKLEYQGTLSVNAHHKSNGSFLYPNPTSVLLSSSEAGTLELYDFYGRMVLSTKIVAKENLNIPHLSKGLYFAVLSTSNSRSFQRITLQ